ncbi:L-aspartate oxidase [Paenarthrobacter sp. NPDC089322]|uniref:L-aspartate oxidase n=1 Tax=Paenarthrobacter sp. NPDC089322 TaxID=3155065 RepID=UPI003416C416
MTTSPASPSLAGGHQRKRLIVVGSGIAGLYSALLAAEAGAEVVLLTKGALADSNTYYAQGGISAVLDVPAPGDTVAAHIADTLQAGAGHCDPDAVGVLCTEARLDIAGLVRFGVRFDMDDDGDPALGLEAAHSAPRILHAGGDATGARISDALIKSVLEVQAEGRIQVIAGAYVTSLARDCGRVVGVTVLHQGKERELNAGAVLLASGGAGQLFAQTTNPAVATADGLALAWRAGADVADLEFFQFHPTCMVPPADPGVSAPTPSNNEPLLISEAVRGEGAILVDATGRRFMPDYHPDAELAPRDVVSRSIALHLAALDDPNGHVFLDATVIEKHRGKGFLEKRFPTITSRTREAGIDWTREPVPVAPAAHYWMGGVVTDLHGRTTVPGLFAAGEAACTGVQGANRLASNSLLEGLVFARRAVSAFLGERGATGPSAPALAARTGDRLASSAASPAAHATTALSGPLAPLDELDNMRASQVQRPFSRQALQQIMTAKAGVLRSGVLLAEAEAVLAEWAEDVLPLAGASSLEVRDHEDANLLVAAQLLVRAARERPASLGAHYRSDSVSEPAAVDDPANYIDKRYTMSRKASLVQ